MIDSSCPSKNSSSGVYTAALFPSDNLVLFPWWPNYVTLWPISMLLALQTSSNPGYRLSLCPDISPCLAPLDLHQVSSMLDSFDIDLDSIFRHCPIFSLVLRLDCGLLPGFDLLLLTVTQSSGTVPYLHWYFSLTLTSFLALTFHY